MTTNQDEHDDYAARCDFEAHARAEEEHRREIETAIAHYCEAIEQDAARERTGNGRCAPVAAARATRERLVFGE